MPEAMESFSSVAKDLLLILYEETSWQYWASDLTNEVETSQLTNYLYEKNRQKHALLSPRRKRNQSVCPQLGQLILFVFTYLQAGFSFMDMSIRRTPTISTLPRAPEVGFTSSRPGCNWSQKWYKPRRYAYCLLQLLSIVLGRIYPNCHSSFNSTRYG